MKRKISISAVLSILILTLSITLSTFTKNNDVLKKNKSFSKTSAISSLKLTDNEEMRGMWVSYLSLDIQAKEKSFDSFKELFSDIIKEAKSLKCNTLIVQIRPFCDALYNSAYFPYSHILSGVQGKNPGYDALEYICEVAHKNNLKVHAWINPLRVKNNYSAFELSENNPYIQNEALCFETESGIYLNPANKDARQLIINGVKEVAENYDVDGIQFDDYFYPENISNEDYIYYEEYTKSVNPSKTPLSLHKWRENNINLLICETYMAIKETDENIVFGISPQGNINNNKNIYADVVRWCETLGYIDYICPQLYYSTDNPDLAFEDALKNWSEISFHNKLKVYIGLAAYKISSDEDNGTWLIKNDILKTELLMLRNYGYDGFMIYEYKSIKNPDANEELENLKSVI